MTRHVEEGRENLRIIVMACGRRKKTCGGLVSFILHGMYLRRMGVIHLTYVLKEDGYHSFYKCT